MFEFEFDFVKWKQIVYKDSQFFLNILVMLKYNKIILYLNKKYVIKFNNKNK